MGKTCHVALVLVLVCYAAHIHGASDDVESAWENFQAHHPTYTKSQTEAVKRKENFVRTHAMIQRHKQNNSAIFEMEHNQFSVMDDEEKRRYIGARPPSKVDSRFLITDQLGYSMRELPTSLDYRTNRCLAAVKNQGSCGSCWAFSAIATLEFAQCKKTGTSVLLSITLLKEFLCESIDWFPPCTDEQQLVDCDPNNNGCGGGWYTTAWAYQKNGTAKKSLYTYNAIKGACKFTTSMIGSTIATYANIVSNSSSAMKVALMTYGPISVGFFVSNSFYSYKSGVYTDVKCDNLGVNHCMVAVGWGTLFGVDYWIVRNSWGTSWGIFGYVLIQRGVNKCNIETYPAVVTSVV